MRWTTTDDKIWYLHSKEVQMKYCKRINYYFKKVKEENSCELPIGYKVIQTRAGMPVLKKL